MEDIDGGDCEGLEGSTKAHRQRSRKSRLYKEIRSQMEFYFSDANLTKQRVMRSIVQESEYVPLSIFVEKFNKLAQLTKRVEDVCRALKKSERLELSEDGTGVKRKVPFDDSKTKDETVVESCTIYVENIPLHVDHSWVEKIFQEFGQIAYVSLPKFKRSKQPKGFAFVEFEDEEAAKRCLEAFGEMGGCLPTNIDPSALMSISTFSDEQEEKPKKGMNLRKRRGDKDIPTVDENLDECEDIDITVKRSKLEHEQIASGNPTDQSHGLKKEIKTENLASDAAIANPASETDMKAKKKKRRKKPTAGHDEKIESDLIQLKILPKRNWRQLRNRYLNLQRENFGKLKAQLRASASASKHLFVPEQTSTGQYKSVCVNITLPVPEPRLALVSKINTELAPPDWSNFVKYVDYEDNKTEVIVRLDGGPAAASAITSFVGSAKAVFANARLMSEAETDEYWALSKAKLKEQKKQKLRGKDHLLNQARKVASSHIHFDTN